MQGKIQIISPIKQRMLQFVEYLQISKRDFYTKTSISRGTLESNTGITEETMAKFLATYSNVNAYWLYFGDKPMLKDNKGEFVPESKHIATYSEDGVPLIPIEAMAGFGVGDVRVMDYDITDRYVVPDFTDVDFMIRVKGNSMYPKYNSGDVIACKKLPLDTFIQWNKVHVLSTTQGAMVKRVMKSDNDDSWLLVSDNEAYPPFYIPKTEVHSIAIVVGGIWLE